MEHLEFFELPSDPFQNDADARFYYESAPQKRARLRLLRGIHQRKGLAVLEGGPGLGKTTLAHVVLRALEEKDYAAHYLSIPHESCASGWLLPNVARAFGVPVLAGQVSQLVDQIHAQLVAITTARRMPVLLIDEAQLFRNREAMEEFRGLLNLSHEGRKLISLVLFGLPELGELLKLDPPLAQRVEVRVEMSAMDWLESQAYVSHRLRLAGAAKPVFSPDALEALFRWSGGVPRVLNTLADNAIFEGFLTETRPVDSHLVQTAAQALGLLRVPSDSLPNIPPPAPAAPDLLSVTEVAMPTDARKAEPELPKPARQTMPVAKPSPAPAPAVSPAARGPKIELPADDEPELAAAADREDDGAPDWLEPLSPMPQDTPPDPTAKSVELEEEPALDLSAEEAEPELMDLEEVVAEDTTPPTPARPTRVTSTPALSSPLDAEVEAELDLTSDDDEPQLGVDSDDDGDVSLRSLMREDSSDGEEEAVLAELGPASAEPEDLAPVRRTTPQAKPSPLRPTPAKAVAARPAPAKPTPAKPAPAKVTPPRSRNAEDEFDLSGLVDEDEPSRPQPALAAPAKDDDDDLDALFDEIQIGDK